MTVAALECVPPSVPTRTTRSYALGKDDYLARLRKIEGQVRGLERMIENDRWCTDVVVQIASASRALQVAVGVLNDLSEVAATIRQVIRL